MTLTKNDLIDSIYDGTEMTKAKSAELVDALLETMKNTLMNGEDILITGFGKFCVKNKNPRRGRNPQRGTELTLDARRVVKFKCSGKLRDEMNRR